MLAFKSVAQEHSVVGVHGGRTIDLPRIRGAYDLAGVLLWSVLRGYRDIVLAAVNKDGYSLLHASKELRNHRDIVLAAVNNDGEVINYASEEPRNDREIVLAAVKNDGEAIKYASEELQRDREIVPAAASSSSRPRKKPGFRLLAQAFRSDVDRDLVLFSQDSGE